MAFYMKMSFHSHANKTHFLMEGCAPGLALKNRHKTTRKWPFYIPAESARIFWYMVNNLLVSASVIGYLKPQLLSKLIKEAKSLSLCQSAANATHEK